MPKFTEGFASTVNVPPGARDVLVFDTEVRGFGIRKFAGGAAYYFVKYTHEGKQRRQSLGEVTRGNLRAMRLLASEVKSRARAGQDIIAEKQAAETRAEAEREATKNRKTLGTLVTEYLTARKGALRQRSYLEVQRHLRTQWLPLHARDIKTIIRADVVAVLDALERDSGKVAADRARVSLSTLFMWAIDRGYCDTTPMLNIKARSVNGARERVLTEAELVEIWRTCLDNDYGRIVRLLILTGQRKSEIGDLLWVEVNVADRQVELPSVRTKNKRPHVVPLSTEALALLLPRRGDRAHVFGRRAGTGFSGWSKAKRELDARIAMLRKKRGISETMPSWTIHDLRRSFVTHVLEKRLALPHVAEACVNHISGHKAGVAGIYNRAEYSTEKCVAVEMWARWIKEIVA